MLLLLDANRPFEATRGAHHGIQQRVYQHRSHHRQQWHSQQRRAIYDRLADGFFKPEIARTFSFDQTVEAYRYLESNEQIGKVVITL